MGIFENNILGQIVKKDFYSKIRYPQRRIALGIDAKFPCPCERSKQSKASKIPKINRSYTLIALFYLQSTDS